MGVRGPSHASRAGTRQLNQRWSYGWAWGCMVTSQMSDQILRAERGGRIGPRWASAPAFPRAARNANRLHSSWRIIRDRVVPVSHAVRHVSLRVSPEEETTGMPSVWRLVTLGHAQKQVFPETQQRRRCDEEILAGFSLLFGICICRSACCRATISTFPTYVS